MNKTTLKSLKAELEMLKASKSKASKNIKDTGSTHKSVNIRDVFIIVNFIIITLEYKHSVYGNIMIIFRYYLERKFDY